MYCQNCGALVDDTARVCGQCGLPPLRTAARASSNIDDDTGMRMLLPVGRSFWAIAAGYAGLFAVLILPAPAALLLGIIALWDLKQHPEKHGKGRAIFGTVMGALGTIVLAVGVVAAILASMES